MVTRGSFAVLRHLLIIANTFRALPVPYGVVWSAKQDGLLFVFRSLTSGYSLQWASFAVNCTFNECNYIYIYCSMQLEFTSIMRNFLFGNEMKQTFGCLGCIVVFTTFPYRCTMRTAITIKKCISCISKRSHVLNC